jgi:hypothetical protein
VRLRRRQDWGQKRKNFFFEKKKQKTFANASGISFQTAARMLGDN